MATWSLALITVCLLVLKAIDGASQEPSPVCLQSEVKYNTVISVDAATEKGAKFLKVIAAKFNHCRHLCCLYEKCDTALYFRLKRRCYLIHCGNPSLCEYIEDKRFIASRVIKTYQPIEELSDPDYLSDKKDAPSASPARDVSTTQDKIEKKPSSLTETKSADQYPEVIHATDPPSDIPIVVDFENKKTQRVAKTTSPTRSQKSDVSHSTDKLSIGANPTSPVRVQDWDNYHNRSSPSKSNSHKFASAENTKTGVTRQIESLQERLQHTVTELRTTVTILSIFLALSIVFTLFIICRAKIMINRLTPEVVKMQTRGEESDFLINGIYS